MRAEPPQFVNHFAERMSVQDSYYPSHKNTIVKGDGRGATVKDTPKTLPHHPVPLDMSRYTPEPTPQSSPTGPPSDIVSLSSSLPKRDSARPSVDESKPFILPPLPPLPRGNRKASTTSWLFQSPEHPGAPPVPLLSPAILSPLTPADSLIADDMNREVEGEDWSSAVGRAGLGKSGRVIEKLMQETDRLRRDIRAQQSMREDVEAQLGAQRPKIERLEEENANLVQMRMVDETIFEKRARKVQDLKEQLDEERKLRKAAEDRIRATLVDRDEAIAQSRREVLDAQEEAKREKAHADVLRGTIKQRSREYEQRLNNIKTMISDIVQERDQDRDKLQRLEIVMDQMRQATANAEKVNAQLNATQDTYKRNLASLVTQLEEKEATNTMLQKEIRETVEKMRWVINVKSNVRIHR